MTLTSTTLTASGTGNDVLGISSVKLYFDANANGVADAGETLLGSGVYASDNGTAVINFSSVIPAGATATFLVVYDFSPAAGTGAYSTSVVNASSLTGSNATGPVLFSGTPLNGAVVTIANATATPSPTPSDTSTTAVSGGVTILPPYPNPSMDGVPVTVEMKFPGTATLNWAVFTTAFRKISSGSQVLAGNGAFQWDLRDKTSVPVAKGIYYIRLELVGDFGTVRKIVKVIVL